VKSAVTINGTIDKPEDADEGYVVEAAIPWKSFSKAEKVPPEPGTTWRLNFYAMENNGGVAWSPILGQGNFHRASRFGRVLFATKDWKPPAPNASGSAPPPASAAPPGSAAAPTTSAAVHEKMMIKQPTPKAVTPQP
jgi:hypothetical protein